MLSTSPCRKKESSEERSSSWYVNLLHPNICKHILRSLLYTFSLVLVRRICLTIKASYVGDHFLYSHDLSE